ncbi:MAG: RodZ domain-containing protein [Pseudomonadota bacterium]
MTEETEPSLDATLFPKTVGERLRDARLAQKLDLAEIAQRTRVPLRHLQSIEDNDYSQMPTPTYTVGFAKAYARAVGVDEVEIAREIRGAAELHGRRIPEVSTYEDIDAGRGPSGGLMLGAVAVALIVLVAAGLWFGTTVFRGDGLTPAPTAAPSFLPETSAEPAAPPVATAGQVALVATDEVWVRVYDAGGTTLFQKAMAAGERYDVPADATDPRIQVGRADKLQVLVNGSTVPPLGDGRTSLKDVPIGAAALLARGAPDAAPSATPSASGSPAASASAIPPAFRDTRPARAAQPAARALSTGQRETAPAPTTEPTTAPPAAGNITGTP